MLHRPREDVPAGVVLAAVCIVGSCWNLPNGSWAGFFFDAIGGYFAVGERRHVLAFRALEDRIGGGRHAGILACGVVPSPLPRAFCGFPTGSLLEMITLHRDLLEQPGP